MKIVQKYGGSSLADDGCLRRVAQRIAADSKGHRMLAVVSAQGKTTDRLTSEYLSLTQTFPSRESDALLATGEQVSAAKLAAVLCDLGYPAVSLNGAQVPIYASGEFGNGRIRKILLRRIRREWKQGKIVIVTGFQGIDRWGNLLTLGRGGSDTSAVALAAALKAVKCLIFTDVDGVYSADPRRFPFAVKFPEVNLTSMLKLARAGAKVLHPQAVLLARDYNVPLEVLSSFSFESGTSVSSRAPLQSGITVIDGEETAEVKVVFGNSPDGPLMASVYGVCDGMGAVGEEADGIFRVTVAKESVGELVSRIHKIIYPDGGEDRL